MKEKNKPDKSIYADFFIAIEKGDEEALNKILEEYDIDVNRINSRKELPTSVAKVFKRDEILEILQKRGANIDEENCRSILFSHQDELCEFIDQGVALEVIEELFEEGGADVNELNSNGQSPLYRAAWSKNNDLCKMLLEKGANPNFEDDKKSLLYCAVLLGNNDLCKMLLEKGANPNFEYNGRTLFESSCVWGAVDIAESLFRSGANPYKSTDKKLSPLEKIALRDDQKLLSLIIPEDQIDDFIKASRARAIIGLSYSMENFGMTDKDSLPLLGGLVSGLYFDQSSKDIFLNAMNCINDENKTISLPGGNQLGIMRAPYKDHMAYFLIESDSEKKPLKLSYCDGNIPIRNGDKESDKYIRGYSDGEVTFAIDGNKMKDERDLRSYLKNAFNGGMDDFYKDDRDGLCKALSEVVIYDKSVKDGKEYDIPRIIESNIPTKPQKRGNCVFKSFNIALRSVIAKTNPEMTFEFDEESGKVFGNGHNLYKAYKTQISSMKVNEVMQFADPSNKENLSHDIAIRTLEDFVLPKARDKKGHGSRAKEVELILEKNARLPREDESLDSAPIIFAEEGSKEKLPSSTVVQNSFSNSGKTSFCR